MRGRKTGTSQRAEVWLTHLWNPKANDIEASVPCEVSEVVSGVACSFESLTSDALWWANKGISSHAT